MLFRKRIDGDRLVEVYLAPTSFTDRWQPSHTIKIETPYGINSEGEPCEPKAFITIMELWQPITPTVVLKEYAIALLAVTEEAERLEHEMKARYDAWLVQRTKDTPQ